VSIYIRTRQRILLFIIFLALLILAFSDIGYSQPVSNAVPSSNVGQYIIFQDEVFLLVTTLAARDAPAKDAEA
jgi:hypothetical protein